MNAALDADRLPWLTDGPTARPKQGWLRVGLLAFAGSALLAILSYWAGRQQAQPTEEELAAETAVTVSLEDPVDPPVMPLPEPGEAATPNRAVAVPQAPKPVRDDFRPRRRSLTEAAPQVRPKIVANREVATPPVVNSARIGTFSSVRQAKIGWNRIVGIYPGMRGLKASVLGSRSLRDGKLYYRLRFATTSHAHSEVLCQPMRMVGQSCVVVRR